MSRPEVAMWNDDEAPQFVIEAVLEGTDAGEVLAEQRKWYEEFVAEVREMHGSEVRIQSWQNCLHNIIKGAERYENAAKRVQNAAQSSMHGWSS